MPGQAGFVPPPARIAMRCGQDVPKRLLSFLAPDESLSPRHRYSIDDVAALLGVEAETVTALVGGTAEPIWPLTSVLQELSNA